MFERRIIQYDISRGRIPRLETVFRRLDLLRPHGVTGLALYIESVVATDTFPAVGCGETPVTKEYLRALSRRCSEIGVELIPFVEVIGHQGKLLALDAFERLGEIAPPHNRNAGHNNFLLHEPEARAHVKRWLDELLPLFNSDTVHLCCDEAFALGTGRSRSHIERHGVEATIADYLIDLHRHLSARGKRTVVTGDFLVHFPALRDMLPSEILIANWGYGRWEDAYEQDNHHFARHEFITERSHGNWVLGNNMAEYVFPPFQRIVANTDIWLDLGARSRAEAFVITDWGSYSNINPHVLSLLGDLHILLRLQRGRVEIAEFLDVFSHMILGRVDARFTRALDLMGHAQMDPECIQDERLLRFLPIFPSLMLGDPNDGSRAVRRFACLRADGLARLEARMREAVALMDEVPMADAPLPDYAHDMRMLARRLLMVALRARLCCDDAWDTGCIWHSPGTLAPRHRLLDEYVALSGKDQVWYSQRWNDENLISDKAGCMRALSDAQESIRRRVLQTPYVNTLFFHGPGAVHES